MREVVITGIGTVSPLGLTREETWKGLVEGRSGIGPITLFDAASFPVRIGGEVKNFDFEGWIRREPGLQNAWRASFFAAAAAEEALQDARFSADGIRGSERFGIYLGAGDSGNDFPAFSGTVAASLNQDGKVDAGRYFSASSRLQNGQLEFESQPFMTAAHLAGRFGMRGPSANCLTACAASSQALGEAAEIIRRGDADVMMSGGAHSMLYPLGIAGFALLTALSRRNEAPEKASRPFDKNRDGFVLSEGACVVILEELEHARKRGAFIYGKLAGYGATADAYRLTDMDPQGSGACRALETALKKSGASPRDVDYINAHGTSTQVNDAIETLVIKKVMGDEAGRIPVSSIKSMLGHTIAAAGAMELMACVLAMRDSVLPPTINYEERDEHCDLDYVPNEARKQKVNTAVSNSFGFGGQNICLVVKKYEG